MCLTLQGCGRVRRLCIVTDQCGLNRRGLIDKKLIPPILPWCPLSWTQFPSSPAALILHPLAGGRAEAGAEVAVTTCLWYQDRPD